jgi:hypothetical protein
MKTVLRDNGFPMGTKKYIGFMWDLGIFEIGTYERNYFVSDLEIKNRNGKYIFNPSEQNTHFSSEDIEIPADVIERKNNLNLDLALRKNNIGNMNHKEGKIYFSLGSDGQIIAKCGNKEAIADKIETVENKRAIDISALGLSVPYVEVPLSVEKAFVKASEKKYMANCCLVSAGCSLLTARNYFKFNSKIPQSKWESVEEYFEDFGEGDAGLKGWLTSDPKTVEDILKLERKLR